MKNWVILFVRTGLEEKISLTKRNYRIRPADLEVFERGNQVGG